MNGSGKQRGGRGRLLHVVVAAIAILAMLPLTAIGSAAQATTTITVSSFTGDGVTPLPFVRFQVTDNATGTIYGPFETPPGTAQVVFTIELTDPEATFTIEEETPPPCGIAPDPLVVGPLVEGEDLPVEFSTDFDDTCDQGALSAYKYSCPDDFDTSATNYEAWRDGCTEAVNGATFEFTRVDSGFAFQAETGAYGIAGRAPYVGLDPGDYTIGELDETATPTVYCLTYSSPNPAEAPSYDSAEAGDVTDGTVAVTLDNNRIACDFFYTQSTPGDGGNVTPGDDTSGAGAGTGSIELHKAECPAGYEPNNDIFDDCHGDGVAGVEFTIDGPGSSSDAAETVIENTPGPGIVRFTDLPEGTYTIDEDVPDEGNSIYVYCSLAQAEDQVPFTYNDAGGIDLDLGDGVDVICDWYNIPDPQDEGAAVRVTKYTCEAGYDAGAATYADFLADCPDPTQGVTFTLAADGGDQVDKTTNANGVATFSNLAADTYQLSEDVPGEFSTPYAFCTVDGGDPFQADTSDGSTYFEIDDTVQQVECDWFNVPEDLAANASVTIAKYLCPPGQSSAFADNCDEPLGGVTFGATGPQGYDVSGTTGDDGGVVFDGLTAGNYVITEFPPDDPHVDLYVVSCTEGGDAFDFGYDDSTGLRINLKVGTNDDIRCDWYNVPPKPGPSGSITVNKLLCQGKEDNDYDWQNDCEVYSSGADFDLLAEDGTVLTNGTTNGDGELVFTGLADGAYGLDETSADWCHAESDIVDAAGNVVVEDGADTDVFIYNCTTKQVRTLPSTGVGPVTAGPVAGSGIWAMAGGLVGVLLLLALRRRQPAVVTARR
ncbi:MAG: large repetitive protein [Thermomicrobiales bacterium]|nr:large repetitive protein [Thermomicrobiales bacterium]